MLTITSYGHACHTLSTSEHSIVLDPYLTGNPQAPCGPDTLQVDAILPSHGHGDHLGDTVAIATRLGCPVIACAELCAYCKRHGCEVAPMHIGGTRTFPFGTVKLTPAWHGSAIIKETIEYVGLAVGFLITMGGVRVYFAGDTALFGDMKYIGDAGLDVAILPIGDCYTMGPADALIAVELLRPKLVIPMHYNTFDLIKQDPKTFAAELEQRGTRCQVLAPGETLQI